MTTHIIHDTGGITVTSFGYLHGEPPTADRVVDVREFSDPATREQMRADGFRLADLTGQHPDVRRMVLGTDGVHDLIVDLAVEAVLAGAGHSIAVGCAGGRHRSVAIAEQVAAVLTLRGLHVTVVHRDMHHPRVLSAAEKAAAEQARESVQS